MNINLPNISIPSSSLIIIAIGIIAFILFVILAQMSRTFLAWNFSGAGLGFFVGIILTAIIGGFLVLKGGEILRNLATWNQTPESVKKFLVTSRLAPNVLGAETHKVNSETVKEDYNSLNSQDKDSVKNSICH